MPSYSELKKQVFRERRKAIEGGIPSEFSAMVDAKIDKAIFTREDPLKRNDTPTKKRLGYQRGVSELSTALDVLRAFNYKLYLRNRDRLKFIDAQI